MSTHIAASLRILMLPNGASRYVEMQLYELTYSWLAWIEAALLLGLLLIGGMRPQAISQTVQVLASPIQRRYSEGSSHPLLKLLTGLFQWGTISLAIVVAVKGVEIQFAQYAAAAGVLAAMTIIKVVADKYILFTFRFPIHEGTYTHYRQELWQLAGIVLWGYLLFSGYMSSTWRWGIPLAIAALYYIVLWWKLMQLFGWSINNIAGVTLYLLHLEVLPMAVVVIGCARYIR